MKDILKMISFACVFAVPTLTLVVANDYFFPYITGKNFWFRILVDLGFAAWALLALLDARYRPRVSGIVWSFGVLLVIMLFANAFGVHPASSFWSNFERMDGYVSLVHTFLYLLVTSSLLLERWHWRALLNTSFVVAIIVALYGLAQHAGIIEGAATRIDSRLGNAAYMAVYMLFHVFVAAWLWINTKNLFLRAGYGLATFLFIYVLIETGTRGTAVGLAVGLVIMATYIAIFGKQYPVYRDTAMAVLVVVVMGIGSFVIFKDADFVQSRPNLARVANISSDDLDVRFMIWSLALEGVAERPLLGYGQSNFNYVFNEHYDPRLFDQEQWFDRAHNIFIDWLTTGGILGLLAYLSIFAACVYYLFWRPWRDDEDTSFTVLERGILLGLLAGYFTHNLAVFDNIVSYIFFALVLGLINQRVGRVPTAWQTYRIEPTLVSNIYLPVAFGVLVLVFIHVHRPGMLAAGDIIDGYRAAPVERLAIFEKALERDSFARQELTEQLVQQTTALMRDETVSHEVKADFRDAAETALRELITFKPHDARVHLFAGDFYRTVGDYDQAAEQMALARRYSPNKQSIIIQQGFVALAQNDPASARDFFQTAYELDTSNLPALTYLAVGHLYADEAEAALALADTPQRRQALVESDIVIAAASEVGAYAVAADLMEERLGTTSDSSRNWRANPQTWASAAFLRYQANEKMAAIDLLEASKIALPNFATSAECFISNIEAGRNPQVGC